MHCILVPKIPGIPRLDSQDPGDQEPAKKPLKVEKSLRIPNDRIELLHYQFNSICIALLTIDLVTKQLSRNPDIELDP